MPQVDYHASVRKRTMELIYQRCLVYLKTGRPPQRSADDCYQQACREHGVRPITEQMIADAEAECRAARRALQTERRRV